MMLKPYSLDSLFSLLHEMTLVQREDKAFQTPARVRRWEYRTICAYLIAVALLVGTALAQKKWPSAALGASLWPLYVIVVMLALAYLLLVLFNIGYFAWRHRKQRFAGLLARIRLDIEEDASFLARLYRYDKAALEYAQLQYRHHWNIVDSRVCLLTGNLRKIGLCPALTASSIAASTLLKNDNNMYFWIPLIATACFYLMAFCLYGQSERPQQVVDLIDFAISHARDATEPGHEAVAHESRANEMACRSVGSDG